MNRPSYKELWSDEYKDRDEQLQWIRNAVNGNAKFRNSEPPYSEEEELARKIMQMHARIVKLEEKLAELVEVGNKMRDLIEQDYDGYLDETIEWRGVAEEADDVLQEREE